MPFEAAALVLVGAIFAALYDVLCKSTQRGVWQDRSSLVSFLALAGASVFLLITSFATGGPEFSDNWLIPVLATGTLNIVGFFANMRARALEDVSLVSPISSTTPAIVIMTAAWILGEVITPQGWIGILILVFGTYTLNIEDLRQKMNQTETLSNSWLVRQLQIYLEPFRALGRSTGVRWAFVAVGTGSVSLVFDGLVARRVDVGFGFGLVFAIAAMGNLAATLLRGEHRAAPVAGSLYRVVLLGGSVALTTFITSWAYRLSEVAYVGTMKRFNIPIAIVMAYFFLKERQRFKDRLVAGILMVIGATLIVLSK